MYFSTLILRRILRQTFHWIYLFVLPTIFDMTIVGSFAYLTVVTYNDIFEYIIRSKIRNIKLKDIVKDIVKGILTKVLSFSFWKEKIMIITMLLFVIISVWMIFCCLIFTYVLMCTRNGRYIARQLFRRYFRRIDHQQNHIQNNQNIEVHRLMNGDAFRFQ